MLDCGIGCGGQYCGMGGCGCIICGRCCCGMGCGIGCCGCGRKPCDCGCPKAVIGGIGSAQGRACPWGAAPACGVADTEGLYAPVAAFTTGVAACCACGCCCICGRSIGLAFAPHAPCVSSHATLPRLSSLRPYWSNVTKPSSLTYTAFGGVATYAPFFHFLIGSGRMSCPA